MYKILQNGTTDQLKKIIATLNEGDVPSQDIVGKLIVCLKKNYFTQLHNYCFN